MNLDDDDLFAAGDMTSEDLHRELEASPPGANRTGLTGSPGRASITTPIVI
jgi:hypothetical protein